MENNIVEEIRKFVEDECRKPSSKYGFEPYDFHFVPMHNYAKILAGDLGANLEIVEIAAWGHDIGSIINGRANHHITGARIIGNKLVEMDYSLENRGLVKHCILAHRSSGDITALTIEAKIISDADALSNFDNVPGIFKAAFVYERLTQGEARISVRQKLAGKWNKLYLEESKKLIKPKYDAAMLLLK